MQTIQYRESRIWEMKENKYTKIHAKNQAFSDISCSRYRKNVLPWFYPNGDAMCHVGVSLRRRRCSRVPAPLSGAGTHDERLRGRLCCCPFEGHKLKYGRRKPTETSVF